MLFILNFFKRIFAPRQKPFICGGIGVIEVVDSLGRVKSKLYYTRPDSDMKLNYTYEYQNITANEKQLREIKTDKDKGGNVPKKIHEIIERELFIPYAEKIFVKCEGYYTSDKKCIDYKTKEEQLKTMKKYYSNHLVSMVANAFTEDSRYKKKD